LILVRNLNGEQVEKDKSPFDGEPLVKE